MSVRGRTERSGGNVELNKFRQIHWGRTSNDFVTKTSASVLVQWVASGVFFKQRCTMLKFWRLTNESFSCIFESFEWLDDRNIQVSSDSNLVWARYVIAVTRVSNCV